jgi:glycosyltransferase involved in cell wall biosynthesis
MRRRGHHVESASLYLPVEGSDGGPVFCGAVGMYLRHQVPFLRRWPSWAQRLLDARPLLAMAGRLSGATRPGALQGLTLAMLRGDAFAGSADAADLVRWLAAVRPDVIHLSNALLIGLARPLRRSLGVPVTCTLQDEDTWIDSLQGSARQEAWEIMARQSDAVDLFLPVSVHYGRTMADRMGLSPGRFMVVSPGTDVDGGPDASPDRVPAVIGYLSRISCDMGAGLLADAVLRLLADGRHPGVCLHMAGGSTTADAPLLRSLRRRFHRAGAGDRLTIVPAFGPEQRRTFLRGLTALSVPVLRGGAFGLFLLEAMAAGVPVVQPRLGGFTELVEATGGGVLYEPNTVDELARSLARVIDDRPFARRLGRDGQAAVRTRYTSDAMAAAMEIALAAAVSGAGGRTV